LKKLLLVLMALLFMAVSAFAQTSYNIRSRAGQDDYHPEIWQSAYCITEGGNNFMITADAADTSAIYNIASYEELWLYISPDADAGTTGTDSVSAYVVIEIRDNTHGRNNTPCSGWKRIDSVAVVGADTLAGVWHEATKIPPGTHMRTIVVADGDNDIGGTIYFPHWIIFKQ